MLSKSQGARGHTAPRMSSWQSLAGDGGCVGVRFAGGSSAWRAAWAAYHASVVSRVPTVGRAGRQDRLMRPECDQPRWVPVSFIFFSAPYGQVVEEVTSEATSRRLLCQRGFVKTEALAHPRIATVGRQLRCPLSRFPYLDALGPDCCCSGRTGRLADEATALGTTGSQSLPRLPLSLLGKPYRRLIGLVAVSSDSSTSLFLISRLLGSGDADIWIHICPSRLGAHLLPVPFTIGTTVDIEIASAEHTEAHPAAAHQEKSSPPASHATPRPRHV